MAGLFIALFVDKFTVCQSHRKSDFEWHRFQKWAYSDYTAERIWTTAERCADVIKGQMNQKIDIFSFVALTSPNTKKNHPKWDLGKDFSSQAFIER